jgi:hypothetical protein
MVDMTFLAGNCSVLAGQLEGGQVVVISCRCPAVSGMAGTTIGAQAALVGIFWRVAGNTIQGCALQDMIDMTFLAGDRGVFAGQFEGSQVVVEGGR